jgi:hypothetical protein
LRLRHKNDQVMTNLNRIGQNIVELPHGLESQTQSMQKNLTKWNIHNIKKCATWNEVNKAMGKLYFNIDAGQIESNF